MNVYIDGENLRHRLLTILIEEKQLVSSDDPFKFDIPKLLNVCLSNEPADIFYYTTRIKLPNFNVPEKLIKRIEAIQELSRRWIAGLTNQGIKVIKAGNLKVRQSSVCIHCGKKTLILQEKGVDVRLATDVVMAAVQNEVNHIVILSSDADMIPAIQVVKKVGTKVTYLSFAESVNQAISAVADQTLTYTRKQIMDVYKADKAS